MVGRRALDAFGDGRPKSNRDGSYKSKPVALRFKDAANKAMEDETRNHIKKTLIDAVKGDELESFRKYDDEVCLPLHSDHSHANPHSIA